MNIASSISSPNQAPLAHAALLIIDMQVGLLHGQEQPYQKQNLLSNTNLLLGRAHAAKVPVCLVRHTGPDSSPIAVNSAMWQLTPELELTNDDFIFNKTHPSCFKNTSLLQYLREHHVTTLVIGGMKTQYCVDTNCKIANEHGFQVILATDAHSCMDTPDLSAAQIVAHHNSILKAICHAQHPSDEIRFETQS